MKTLPRIALTLVVLLVSLSGFTGTSFAEETLGTETYTVVSPIQYVVQYGDTLHRLSRRYQTTVEELVSQELNPQLAERGNPDLIYVGEVITVPVYELVQKPVEDIEEIDLLALPAKKVFDFEKAYSTLLVREKLFLETIESYEEMDKAQEEEINGWAVEVAELERVNKTLLKVVFVGFALLVLSLVLIIILGTRVSRNKKATLQDKRAEEVVVLLRTTPVNTLIEVLNSPITHDVDGARKNPVALKNLEGHVKKHGDRRLDVPMEEWQ